MRGLLLVLLLAPAIALAAIETRHFENADHESRYFDLIDKLRCLVCQNQNLADSNAELALDLRDKTYQMIVDGKSNDEITDFMVSRYGQFVLYEPPFNYHTLLLWLAPAILAGIGAAVFFRIVARRRKADAADIDDADLDRARRLLSGRDEV